MSTACRPPRARLPIPLNRAERGPTANWGRVDGVQDGGPHPTMAGGVTDAPGERVAVAHTMERPGTASNDNAPAESRVQHVRVAAVDDHESVRLGLRAACLDAGYDFIEEAANVDDLVAALRGRECDVVVLDLSLGDGSTVTENVKKIQATG